MLYETPKAASWGQSTHHRENLWRKLALKQEHETRYISSNFPSAGVQTVTHPLVLPNPNYQNRMQDV